MNWRFWKKEKKEIRIVLGSNDEGALLALNELDVSYRIAAEAVTCDGLYRTLKDADLVIANLAELATRSLAPEGLLEIIAASGTPLATPEEFAADPRRWQESALVTKGFTEHLPPKCAAIVSYSGGVGKTTISLDMAALFARKTKLPTMVTEFCYGTSALRAICHLEDAPTIYECITKGEAPAEWRGVRIVPMNFTLARMLASEQIADFLSRERRNHILTVLDCHFPHPLLKEVEPNVWLIVGTPKPDALSNALTLVEEISSEKKVVINMAKGKLGLVGVKRDLTLPQVPEPERYDGRLGEKVLRLIYPHWR